jgi:uncharacterized delta-60 repeat protein
MDQGMLVGVRGQLFLLTTALVGCDTLSFAALGTADDDSPPELVLDPTFGDAGLAVLDDVDPDTYDLVRGLDVTSDGRLLVIGKGTVGGSRQIFVRRLTPDGAADDTFGIGGLCAVGTDTDRLLTVAPTADGGAWGAGTGAGGEQALIMRTTSGGALDTTLGGVGMMYRDDVVGYEDVLAVVPLASGGALMAGSVLVGANGAPRSFRVDAAGSLDATYGLVGEDPTSGAEFGVVQLDSSGRIYVYGSEFDPEDRCFVIRRTAAGALDTSFGQNGTFLAQPDESCEHFAFTTDGHMLLAGRAAGDSAFSVLRLSADGVVDSSFGSAGRVVVPVGAGAHERGVLELADGRIVVGGSGQVTNGLVDVVLWVLQADGTPDDSVGTGGRLIFDPTPGVADQVLTVMLDGLGRILVHGASETAPRRSFVLRLTAAPAPQ